MASRRLLAVFLVLFFMVVSAVAVSSTTGSLKDEVKVGKIHHQDMMELRGDGEQVDIRLLDRRMNVELTDYTGTGANNDHDPGTPGRF
ncbi:Hypothetical predicted protein [Olea europaea subsp. europaea]|uniref:Uncharacterized protein n=1 Tax=Olea europaea subsp. europaea TaxID=158383 RepID=A0A8S0S856_OLEEU|nr:Hypothetical predicted protein [Olea europaea subsp. europaea]